MKFFSCLLNYEHKTSGVLKCLSSVYLLNVNDDKGSDNTNFNKREVKCLRLVNHSDR